MPVDEASFNRPVAGATRTDRVALSVSDVRFGASVWIAVAVSFLLAYLFTFCVVHVHVDTWICFMRLADPLYGIIPHQRSWLYVSHELYYFFTASSVIALLWQACAGNHLPFLRFTSALTIQALLRCTTMTLLPLCKFNVAPGTRALSEVPSIDLGFARIPWRAWATNDLVFSGHVGEFVLLSLATRHWPKPARVTLIAFQLLQGYALIATRGHYTVDVLVAIPFAFFADAVAQRILRGVARNRSKASGAAAAADDHVENVRRQ